MSSHSIHLGAISQEMLNYLCAKFFSKNTNVYLQFLSFPHTDMTQVVEILSSVRQGPS